MFFSPKKQTKKGARHLATSKFQEDSKKIKPRNATHVIKKGPLAKAALRSS